MENAFHFLLLALCLANRKTATTPFQEFSERRPRKYPFSDFSLFSTPITCGRASLAVFTTQRGRVSRSFRTKYCRGRGRNAEITVSGKVTFRILFADYRCDGIVLFWGWRKDFKISYEMWLKLKVLSVALK
ncbi:hypothetical protein CEXT_495931 [Caerostris extrusa]|uniref:Secreted protein n=1 Tax=Caerostris extrusa TaxID=172846 RepID=A0AAV4MTZ8_CAEEX|nr:hypothetical protein CEXT_495931 [Caerostris extrusa]